MPRTGLKGPYALTKKGIEDEVILTTSGAYALGHTNKSGKFVVEYVGRSDSDIEDRLQDWVKSKYRQFMYDYYFTPKEAYEKECHLYHDFGGFRELDNEKHPDRPDGAKFGCPVRNCPKSN